MVYPNVKMSPRPETNSSIHYEKCLQCCDRIDEGHSYADEQVKQKMKKFSHFEVLCINACFEPERKYNTDKILVL